MTPEEIVAKLTEAIKISEKASIWNYEDSDEYPQPARALNKIDDIIVDVITAIDPNWERPN